jgi:hypothetical protein
MGRRPLLVMVLGWFAVVGVVGAITFVVVSNAGSGVGRASAAERVVVVSPDDSASPTQTPTTTPTRTVTPTVPTLPSASTTSEPEEPSEPSDPPEPRPTSKAPRPTAPVPDPHTASFATEGGIVVVSCSGSKVVLKSARPRDDWRFDTEFQRGALEVTFKRAEREVEIYLRCVDGVPTRLKAGSSWGGSDHPASESPSSQLVHPQERVHSEGLEHATPTPVASSTPTTTEETPHG